MKSHDLNYLLNLCVPLDDGFEQWRPWAAPFIDYAARFRYPGAGSPPSADEARESLGVARRIYRFTLDRMPEEAHPER